LIDERQQQEIGTGVGAPTLQVDALALHVDGIDVARAPGEGRHHPVGVLRGKQGDSKLTHLTLTLRARGRGTRLLDRRQQQSDQNGNDGDDDQQFDQREG
jgi:hypothetical protein